MTLYAHPDEDRMRQEIREAFDRAGGEPADLAAYRRRQAPAD